jgi:hypothetical protein
VHPGALELANGHVIKAQHLAGDDGERLAVLGKFHLAAGLDDELVAEQRFQPLHLQADGRLAAAQNFSCAGIATKVYGRDEGAKQVGGQVGNGHGLIIQISYVRI